MEFKNLEELKKFIETYPPIKSDFATVEGIEKQFRNRIYNSTCIFYSVKDEKGYWFIEKFYCDKNGTAITKEQFELEKSI